MAKDSMSHDFQTAPASGEWPTISWAIRELAGYSNEAFWADFARASKQRQEKIARLGEQRDDWKERAASRAFSPAPFPHKKPTTAQKASLLAYMTLWDLLEQTYGIAKAPLFGYEADGENGKSNKGKPSSEESKNSKGKPTLAVHPDIHFSLSHTDNAILAAVANTPVGADIQAFRRPSERLLSRMLSHEERRGLESLDDQEKALAFTQMWTRKEAFLKMTGEGIQSLHNLGLEVPEETAFEEGVSVENGFAWSICAEPGIRINQ